MNIDKRVLDFVSNHRISVLTTILKNGMPHSATMHYATDGSTLDFIFFTKVTSRKCSNLKLGQKSNASLVVGFSEEEWEELQLEGEIELLDKASSINEVEVFSTKFAGAALDDEHVVLKFTPTWWRYTQFKPKPAIIITSD